MLAYLAGLILIAYMASVQVYKIWYITTAAVLPLLLLFARPSWRELREFLSDAKWFTLYWIAVAVSVITSINPERSQLALLVDAIYPCVFGIFYLVGLRSSGSRIERMMRLQVLAAVIILWLTLDIQIAGRVGYRLIFILPYVVPFVVIAICRGSKLAILELAAISLIMSMAGSRAQAGTALALAVISFWTFRTSIRSLARQTAVTALACMILIGASTQFEAPRKAVIASVVRTTELPVVDQGREVAVPIDDHAREHISELFWQMADQGGLTGIGYYAFGPLYLERWKDYPDMSLHSIYEVWWLETGYFGTIAAALMLVWFFVKVYRERSDTTVRACAISTIGALMAGAFHQMHQTPMLYVMLGMGLGCVRQVLNSRQQPSPDDRVDDREIQQK